MLTYVEAYAQLIQLHKRLGLNHEEDVLVKSEIKRD